MRYWKCVKSEFPELWTVGKIYETDEYCDGLCANDGDNFGWNKPYDFSGVKFKEIIEKESENQMEIKLDLSKLTPEQIESLKSQVEKMVEENSKPRELSSKELSSGFVVSGKNIRRAIDYTSMYVVELYSIGLWRPTREECEKLLKKMQIAERLRQWSLMCAEKVDWSNREQKKYYLDYGSLLNELSKDYVTVRIENSIYFTDKSIIERAIADIGEQNLIDNYFIEV